MFAQAFGRPGIFNNRIVNYRTVFVNHQWMPMPQSGGFIIDGTKARNPFTTRTTDLQPGLLMGQITSSKKYANSVLGVTTGAYTSGGTTLTVSAAQAAEIVRRVGTSGTLKTVGPPSAAGTVAVTSTTFSAVNTSTGDITVTSLGVNKVTGSFIMGTDGSEVIKTFIPDGLGYTIDPDTSADLDFALVPYRGVVDVAQLLPWPADSSLKDWVRAALVLPGCQYVWNDLLAPN